MPYRRLPNTDKSRLKALSTLLENNELYTVRDRFIDWKDINKAKTAYDKLLTLVNQYEIDKKAQSRGKGRESFQISLTELSVRLKRLKRHQEDLLMKVLMYLPLMKKNSMMLQWK